MTDIQYRELVIKILEDSYKATCNGWMLPSDVENVVQGIKNGTPLPKGHGRILDEKDILDIDNNDGGWYDLVDMPEYIAGVKAIIESDKESEDKE